MSTPLPYSRGAQLVLGITAALEADMPRLRIRGSKYRPHIGKKQLAKAATKGSK